MKHGARLTSSICLAVSVMLCLAALLYTTVRFVSPADAKRGRIVGSVESSPSSGPVGAIITVSGAGWPQADGTQVPFGYMIADNCSIVADSQVGTLSGGSFSGWFRWPVGTALTTYTVCAVIGTETAPANTTYTVLSVSAPQVSIFPTTLTAGTQATITGSNYFPAGTTVQLSWQSTSGSVDFSINPATSNSNGSISRTFTVPTTTLASGSYTIVAVVGGGHPPTLSSSATFTYNAPTPKPSPTPSPRPDPTPTQNLSPTATVGTTPITTPAGDSATPAVTQNTGQAPTTNTTGGTLATNQPSRMFKIVAVAVSLVLLIAILAFVLLARRRKAHSRPATGQEIPGTAPATNGLLSWQNGPGSNSALGNGKLFPVDNGLISPKPGWSTLPGHNGSIGSVPNGQVSPTNNGMQPMGKLSTQVSQIQMHYSPYIHLLQQSIGESAGAVANGSVTDADDQTLEAIKRQVQMGLFVAPGQSRSGKPPS